MPIRYRCILEYDGAEFEGWQLQPGRRTVQGTIEAVLKQIFNEDVRVAASGRTDAGVHAFGQVCAFTVAQPRSPSVLLRALNGLFPDDLACRDVAEVPLAFDPRHWAWSKTYRYSWWVDAAPSPLRRRTHWWIRGLDGARMADAASALEGTQDFMSFQASGCSASTTVRTVLGSNLTFSENGVELIVTGQGFLRHMVRNIAGTLTEIGLGRREPHWIHDVLAARDRRQAGRTAPAHGLTLMGVEYRDAPPPWIRFRGEEHDGNLA